ncbi:hypothetical protein [Adhaeretor mobilis]|uniref:Uncharacterized protein n=1 Tax=Adhaeretor mobilis TaxID=1930276 RepID=A0A517N2R0_9BACT|nr:hypothetical protein [Adhaeretor mobilis]QDT01422.1 Hypothetical protein HG15A2_47640 [Adhaeretor mobilis]
MTILIGVDEAGYGPNLGPLCIGVTAWCVPDRRAGSSPIPSDAFDLYKLLAEAVSRKPAEGKIAIADSKQLYKPASHSKGGVGLKHLELGVLAALDVSNDDETSTASLRDYIATTQADPEALRKTIPWYKDSNASIPIDADTELIDHTACRFRRVLEQTHVELLAVRARLVFPEEFNSLVDRYTTKGAALSHVTLALVREVYDACIEQIAEQAQRRNIVIVCDKHGGRNRYGALLQHHFPEQWITTQVESRAASRYTWEDDASRTEISFCTGGESFLPTALASMTAKYHRELAMRSFNAFWQKHVPDIKPTAGYPLDARRFRAEIAGKQEELGIKDRILWRKR